MQVDAQGMDLTIIKSAGHALQRCRYVMAETWCQGFQSYKGTSNDYTDWEPHMRELGFEPLSQCSAPIEFNVLWRNTAFTDSDSPDVVRARCPRCMT